MLTVVGSRANRAAHARESAHSSQHQKDEPASERRRLVEALSDLHQLLEEYAPTWYTEEHHRKAESALHDSRG